MSAPRPHRRKPAPHDFAEVFTSHGWRGVEEAFGARTTCNRRWVVQCGGEDLLQARRQYISELRALRRKR